MKSVLVPLNVHVLCPSVKRCAIVATSANVDPTVPALLPVLLLLLLLLVLLLLLLLVVVVAE